MVATVTEEVDTTDGTFPAPPALGPAKDSKAAAKAGPASFRADGAIDPSRVRLFRGPFNVLRCTIEGEKSVLRAKVVRAFPLSDRSRWVNVLDWKNKDVCLIEDPDSLDEESRRLVEEEIGRFYRISTIERIRSILSEYRTLYWDVETDRGRREFVMKWAADTILWTGPRELMLVDIDTNRFRIPDVERLDPHSKKEISIVV